MAQKKIAVLGGGLASITTVFKLTENPDWQSLYDITVYQVGWRLGGKCASGRNTEMANRIEEHGLHLWFGFYDNAFDIIQKCYNDPNRTVNAHITGWQQAFEGFDFVCLEECRNDNGNCTWEDWPFTLPANNDTPGTGSSQLPRKQLVSGLIKWLKEKHEKFTDLYYGEPAPGTGAAENKPPLLFSKENLENALHHIETDIHDLAHFNLKTYNDALISEEKKLHDFGSEGRRFLILANLAASMAIGMIWHGVIFGGFDKINHLDFREWLSGSGAMEMTLESAPVQAVYGLVFGGRYQYSFEAGTALRGLLRLALTYKGHVYYRMLGGMGDVIFVPFYEVLKKRGVKFEFFHKVRNIGLTDDKKNIAKIEIDIQAVPVNGTYDPLIQSGNTEYCWPSAPKYSELVQGNELEQQKINLESYYTIWQPVGKKTLYWQADPGSAGDTAGDVFHVAILGISIGALPAIAPELIRQSKAWQQMIQYVTPIPTVAFQLWLKCSINQMGWKFANQGLALLGSYKQPYDTWADMSHLLKHEDWPATDAPRNIAYLCGPTPGPNATAIMDNARNADFGNSQFPGDQLKEAKNEALNFVENLSAHIWPGIWKNRTTFDLDQLADITGNNGPQKFDDQYFRHNIDPTELYVMSLTNSSQYRLKTDQSGFGNLYITGDWIDNGFNAGCVEATVMAGLQTARAVSGDQFDIAWENDI